MHAGNRPEAKEVRLTEPIKTVEIGIEIPIIVVVLLRHDTLVPPANHTPTKWNAQEVRFLLKRWALFPYSDDDTPDEADGGR